MTHLKFSHFLVCLSRSCSLNLDFSPWPIGTNLCILRSARAQDSGPVWWCIGLLGCILGRLERHSRRGMADATTHKSIYLRLRILIGLLDEQLSYVLCMKEIEFKCQYNITRHTHSSIITWLNVHYYEATFASQTHS
ncbi:hypothetical protein LX32DRAFT_278208 [Colletotrichum zoysiae]|uniref:Uncharacterized protein n=1 Tax=Colletotrichum zoysiae TaxID=1216348 RepID=A0AAD9H266_9PEZI|nr:hypothetical protein LX32DRAFT_278208 [Colletotrichum zoysiae]